MKTRKRIIVLLCVLMLVGCSVKQEVKTSSHVTGTHHNETGHHAEDH